LCTYIVFLCFWGWGGVDECILCMVELCWIISGTLSGLSGIAYASGTEDHWFESCQALRCFRTLCIRYIQGCYL
jgi:hypothetical protein